MRTPGPRLHFLAVASVAVAVGVGCSGKDELGAHCPIQRRAARSGIVTVIDLCPEITWFEVSPTRAAIGGTIQLQGLAVDQDSANLSFSWSASRGDVDDPRASSTTYRCATPGGAAVTLTVSDGICVDTMSAEIECSACSSTASGAGGGCDGGDG